MEQYYKEPTPVQYNAAGVTSRHFLRTGKGVRLHWHDRMELIRLHGGKAQVGYGDNTAVLEPGQLYIVPPKTPHMLKLLTDTVEYDVLMFDVRWFYNQTALVRTSLESIFNANARFFMTTDDSLVRDRFDELYGICQTQSLEAVASVYRLLQSLLDRCLVQLSEDPGGDATIREVIAYMESNFSQELTTDQLAARFGYSTAHFCRKFKQTTWLSPMNYLRIYRLEEAAKRLGRGGENISTVALACGFPDSNYFTRCFKKHFGVPPTKYEK